MTSNDTICAPASSVSGAVAIVRISGPEAFGVCDKVVNLRRGTVSAAPGFSVRYGEVPGLDEVLVSVFRAPHSYTGEDSVELSCHASPFIVSSLLERLCDAGARMAGPGEFTRRAYLGGKMDLAQAEAVADLIAADGAAAHRVALNQLKGGYSRDFVQLRSALLELCALVELELDFSEEEVEFADRERLAGLLDDACRRVGELCESYRLGNAIRRGVPVAIIGAPNCGKSTLLNRLLGDDRAIVSDIPGTTRDTVEETMTLDGVLYRFIDTAGLRETSDTVERLGIERTREKIRQAEIVIALTEFPAEGGKAGGSDVGGKAWCLEEFEHLRSLCEEHTHFIPVVNKADRCSGGSRASAASPDGDGGSSWASAADSAGREAIRISALTGEGLGALLDAIRAAGFGTAADGRTLVTSQRHLAALRDALAALTAARSSLASGLPGDLLAEDLRSAVASIGSILGDAITPDEVLGEVFGRFCIGK